MISIVKGDNKKLKTEYIRKLSYLRTAAAAHYTSTDLWEAQHRRKEQELWEGG